MIKLLKKGFDKCMKKIEVLTKFIYYEIKNLNEVNTIAFGLLVTFVGLGITTNGCVRKYMKNK